MSDKREKLAKFNIYSSLLYQLVMMVSGIIVPKLLISNFGSELYGATTSIAQFLGYIALLEGGIGGIARAALYKPLAENNIIKINAVLGEIKHFFKIVGYIFIAYVLLLACGYQNISNIEALDWTATFFLVIAISISTFAQYFIGISYAVLVEAAQKSYVLNVIRIATTVLNVISIIFLINLGCNIIIVKLVSGCVFALGPVLQLIYVKKNYIIEKTPRQKDALQNKWTGIGQHIAYFLHSHTDVVVLTIFANLLWVAVYSVYNMVIAAIQSIVSSFSTGMEALFGDMYAKKEYDLLRKTFGEYETLISCIAVFLFSTTIVLITPFIKLYTNGITDVDYIQPLFGIVLSIASVLYSMRTPYGSMVVAAGRFKETRWAPYGEAIINIVLSILLLKRWGIIGVAVGTVCAVAFRFVFYAYYVSNNIINRSIKMWYKRLGLNTAMIVCIVVLGNIAVTKIQMTNYLYWALAGILVSVISGIITFAGNYCFFRDETKGALRRIIKKV